MDSLVSLVEFTAEFGIVAPDQATSDRIQTALNVASDIARELSKRTFTLVTDDVLTLDGEGGRIVSLPIDVLPLLAVTSVVEDGILLVADTDYEWTDAGLLRRCATCWTRKWRSVIVTCNHGYAVIPDAIRGAVMGIAKRGYESPAGQTASQETIGSYTVIYAAVTGSGLTSLEDSVFARYAAGR